MMMTQLQCVDYHMTVIYLYDMSVTTICWACCLSDTVKPDMVASGRCEQIVNKLEVPGPLVLRQLL